VLGEDTAALDAQLGEWVDLWGPALTAVAGARVKVGAA
jgi:hypothetical protein